MSGIRRRRVGPLGKLGPLRTPVRATPLILRYGAGGWNALHQDIYVALSQPGVDFTGGENLLVEQRPRMQSRGSAMLLPLGHAMVFPTRCGAVSGARGAYRAVMRHGVSRVTSGQRVALGVILHDAR